MNEHGGTKYLQMSAAFQRLRKGDRVQSQTCGKSEVDIDYKHWDHTSKIHKTTPLPGTVVYSYNSSTVKAEAGGRELQSSLGHACGKQSCSQALLRTLTSEQTAHPFSLISYILHLQSKGTEGTETVAAKLTAAAFNVYTLLGFSSKRTWRRTLKT